MFTTWADFLKKSSADLKGKFYIHNHILLYKEESNHEALHRTSSGLYREVSNQDHTASAAVPWC